MNPVEAAWNRQEAWSRTADRHKQALTGWRRVVLLLAALAALAGTSSAYFAADSVLRAALNIVASVSALVSPLIVQLRLGPHEMAKWILARATSEAIRSETYRFRTRVGRYASAEETERRAHLANALNEINRNTGAGTPDPFPGAAPVEETRDLSVAEYLKLRVDQQIHEFYRPKSAHHATVAERYRRVHFALMLTGAVLGGIAATGSLSFVALGPWIAVATTLASSTLAHSAAGRHEYLSLSYHATASRLEELRITWTGHESTPENRTKIVTACEDVISSENQQWHAKLLSDIPVS